MSLYLRLIRNVPLSSFAPHFMEPSKQRQQVAQLLEPPNLLGVQRRIGPGGLSGHAHIMRDTTSRRKRNILQYEYLLSIGVPNRIGMSLYPR